MCARAGVFLLLSGKGEYRLSSSFVTPDYRKCLIRHWIPNLCFCIVEPKVSDNSSGQDSASMSLTPWSTAASVEASKTKTSPLRNAKTRFSMDGPLTTKFAVQPRLSKYTQLSVQWSMCSGNRPFGAGYRIVPMLITLPWRIAPEFSKRTPSIVIISPFVSQLCK